MTYVRNCWYVAAWDSELIQGQPMAMQILGERIVLWRHAFANALSPVLTILALSFGGLVSGALITETMFAWPGMGKAIYQAILDNDYNLALVGLLVATFATILGNLLADLAYVWVDPRVSLVNEGS